MIGVGHQLVGLSPNPTIVKQLLDALILLMNNPENPEKLVITKGAGEIVFGYNDGLVNVVNTLNALAKDLGIVIPVKIPERYHLLTNLSHDEVTKTSAVYTGGKSASGTQKGALTTYLEYAGSEGSLDVWHGCTYFPYRVCTLRVLGSKGCNSLVHVLSSTPWHGAMLHDATRAITMSLFFSVILLVGLMMVTSLMTSHY